MKRSKILTVVCLSSLASYSLATKANAQVLMALKTDGTSTYQMRGTFAKVRTTVPVGNEQRTLNWQMGRNYYFIQVGGGSVGFQMGLTEGINWG